MLRSILVFFVLFVFHGPLIASDPPKIPLSLDEAIEAASRENFDIRSAQAELDAASASKNQANAAFLPTVTLSESFLNTNDPLNVFGFKLKQEIVEQSDFNPVLLNDPERIDNFTTKVEIRQPLFNADALFGRSASSSVVDAMQNRKSRTYRHVVLQVKSAYFALALAGKNLEVIKKAAVAARANRDQAENYYNQGLITKSDLLQAEVRVTDLEVQQLETGKQLTDRSNRLKFLLALDEPGTVSPTDTLTPLVAVVQAGDLDVAAFINTRSDISAMKAMAAAARGNLRAGQSQFLPRLNGFASAELNDDTPFGSSGKNWTIGGSLDWTLFKGFENLGAVQKARADHRRATIDLEKSKLKIRTEIESAVNRHETEEKKLVLAKKSLDQSEESYRIIKNRYDKGLEKTTDLLNAELQLSESRLAYLRQIFQYNVSIFNLEFLTEQEIAQ